MLRRVMSMLQLFMSMLRLVIAQGNDAPRHHYPAFKLFTLYTDPVRTQTISFVYKIVVIHGTL